MYWIEEEKKQQRKDSNIERSNNENEQMLSIEKKRTQWNRV